MVTAMACIPAVPREPKLQFVSHSGIVVSAGCGAKLGGEGEVAAPGCATCCPASSSEEAGQPVSRNAVYRMTTAQLQHTARLADQQHSVLEVVDLLSGLPSSFCFFALVALGPEVARVIRAPRRMLIKARRPMRISWKIWSFMR